MSRYFRRPGKFRRMYWTRHGRSYPGKALEEALAKKEAKWDVTVKDGVTGLGARQCLSKGMYLASLPKELRPTLFLSTTKARTREGLKSVLLGANVDLDSVTVDHHPLFQDRLLGRRFEYTSGHAFFKAYPEEKDRRNLVGRFDYAYPDGGESYKYFSVRNRLALQEVEDRYAGDHEVFYLEGHNSGQRMALSIFSGLDEEDFEELPDDIPYGSITVFDRNKKTGLMEVTDRFFVPELVSNEEYNRLLKERKELKRQIRKLFKGD
jgi:broad specificity phosphatase PhoE